MGDQRRKSDRTEGSTLARRSVLGLFGAAAVGIPVAAQSDGGTTYEASIRPPAEGQSLGPEGVYCSADADRLDAIDRGKGDQIRIKRNEDEYALYTVRETCDESPENVVRLPEAGRDGTAPELPPLRLRGRTES